MSCEEADVLIVGGGPVGLAMAAELSYRGISTILVESKPTTSNSPKAISLSARSMEHFRRMGLEKKIQDGSYPPDMPIEICFTTAAYKGKVMYKNQFASWGEMANGEVKEYPLFQHGASLSIPMMCPQFTSEAVIRKHIEDTSKVTKMSWGCQVTTINQDDEGVIIKGVDKDGREKTFKGHYLVGCDGGSSFVRKELNLHMYGKFVLARACSIRFSSPKLFEYMKEAKTAGFNFILNPNISCLLIMLNIKGDYVIHIFLTPSTSDEKVEWHVQNPRKCVENTIGCSDIPFDVTAVSAYNMHALMTTKFREGRCFLAGDSAHQWLPAGGLGLNTGLSDVADLAWKLEAMVKGYGGKYLLDSYEMERRPLDDSTRRFALSLGQNIVGFDIFMKIRQNITRSPIARWILGCFISRQLPRQFTEGIDKILGFQYSNSGIVMHQYNEDGSIRLHCNQSYGFTPASLPGCRAPHVVLPECPTIIDLFGKQFIILIVGGVESDLGDLKEALMKGKVPFSTYTYPPLPELVEVYSRKYFVIRPDGVVAWRSDYQPSVAESSKIVSTITGHTPPPRLPPPISTYTSPPRPVESFIKDLLVRVSISCLVFNYTSLSPFTSGMIGFGVFALLRAVKVVPPKQNIESTSRHQAAVINKYGSADSVLRIEPKHVGKFGPNDVLIRVHAASVNELDLQMRQGCSGITNQNFLKISAGRLFPLILGRDCSGEVVAVGDNVSKYLPGDLVFAAVPPSRQGTHAQLVAVNEAHVAFKPSSIDHKEAASIPWVAMTAWTALVTHAGLGPYNAHGKKILVHQGTGGVGSFAVQILKAWGAYVTTTCTAENTALAHHLGADKVVDDKTGDFSTVLSGYDVVLDTVGCKSERQSLSILKLYQGATYISVVSPREKLVHSLGGLFGEIAFSWLYRYKVFINRFLGGRSFYYSNTEVNASALGQVCGLVESGAVRPLIDAVYSLDEVIDAHKHVETGQTRGKVVLSIP